MKPSLALLTFDFPPQTGGVQRYLYQISQRLATTYEVSVITTVKGTLPAEARFRKVPLPSVGLNSIVRGLRSVDPGLVLVGHAHPRLLLGALISRSAYATIAHGNDFLAAQDRWHRPLFNRLMARSRPVIVHSSALGSRLESVGIAASVVIHPGVDAKRFAPGERAKSSSPKLLTICRLVRRKGIDTMLQAMPALLKRFPDLGYDIGGEGPDRARLEGLVAELNIQNAVRFLGRINEEALPGSYQMADIFVMPVREEDAAIEGFGLVFLEASASGLPVIAGRSGGAAEAVQDGVTGLVVEPDAPKALERSVAALLEDPEKRKRMGEAGRRWVNSEMSWERVAARIVEALP